MITAKTAASRSWNKCRWWDDEKWCRQHKAVFYWSPILFTLKAVSSFSWYAVLYRRSLYLKHSPCSFLNSFSVRNTGLISSPTGGWIVTKNFLVWVLQENKSDLKFFAEISLRGQNLAGWNTTTVGLKPPFFARRHKASITQNLQMYESYFTVVSALFLLSLSMAGLQGVEALKHRIHLTTAGSLPLALSHRNRCPSQSRPSHLQAASLSTQQSKSSFYSSILINHPWHVTWPKFQLGNRNLRNLSYQKVVSILVHESLTHQSQGTPSPSSHTAASRLLCAGSWCQRWRCWWTASAQPPCWHRGWRAGGWSSTPLTGPRQWSGAAARSSSVHWTEQWSAGTGKLHEPSEVCHFFLLFHYEFSIIIFVISVL